jgi:uncharacterized protein YndB with AHSA1/START domain
VSDTHSLTCVQEINAPRPQVYRAFTNAQGLLEWFGDVVEADPRPGGRIYAWWNSGDYAAGTFVHLEADHQISFTWQALGDPAPTTVRILLEENGAGTRVSLFHDDVPAEARAAFNEEWTRALRNLQSVLETGVDKRFYDRPMLGFYVGGLVDEKLQKRLHLPVDYGVHVSGVLAGMGAQRSGLQADDVIAVIDGVEIRQFPDVAASLRTHAGGDTVPTVVYRGANRLDMNVELSKRPVPEYPPAPAELAERVGAIYHAAMAELRDTLDSATEAQASRPPLEGEWSAKQAMAHLLISERWNQATWDLLPEGEKTPSYPGSSRSVDAIAAAYAADELYRELQFTIKLVLNMIKTAPETLASNKAGYFVLAANFEEGIRNHFQEHINQAKAAIKAARQAESESAPA